MRPLIIISPSIREDGEEIKLSRAYSTAIYTAGGTALITDYGNIRNIIEMADGVLLSGGGDIDPDVTGDKADEKNQGQISRERDSFEFGLLSAALEINMPVLGICRGMQVIGAVGGAHIIQHMNGHSQTTDKSQYSHSVNISKNSALFKITRTEKLKVNSFHHQAVGDGFKGSVSAVSDDGFIEAVEFMDRDFVLGVQWHPEHMLSTKEHFSIFRAFVEAAKRYGDKKCYGK